MIRARALRLASLAAIVSIAASEAVDAAGGDRRPVAYTVLDGRTIPDPLGGRAGDAERGAALAADPARGGCLACHAGAAVAGAAPAPPLDGIGARRETGRLRLAVVNLAILKPEATDHAFYDVAGPGEAPEAEVGATRMTAQEIEDLVAWLSAL